MNHVYMSDLVKRFKKVVIVLFHHGRTLFHVLVPTTVPVIIDGHWISALTIFTAPVKVHQQDTRTVSWFDNVVGSQIPKDNPVLVQNILSLLDSN